MSEWAKKRFWREETILERDGGFIIELDGRGVKTPGKSPLKVPTRKLAELIRQEWSAQHELVDPNSMPFTRLANTVIDKVSQQQEAVIDHICSYGASDLLCYRADEPDELVIRQAQTWDPYLRWLEDRYGARLAVANGIMPVRQPGDVLPKLRTRIAPFNVFELAAFHELVSLSGSIVLALAVIEAPQTCDDIWYAAQLDELWQAEKWGIDADAEATSLVRKQAFYNAIVFFEAAQ